MIFKTLIKIFDFFFFLHPNNASNFIMVSTLALSFTYNIFWSTFLTTNLLILSEKDVKTCENLVQINHIISGLSVIVFLKTFLLFKFHNFFDSNDEIDCIIKNSRLNQIFSLITIVSLLLSFNVNYGDSIHCLFIQYYDLVYIILEALITLVLFLVNKDDLIKLLKYKKLPQKID